MEFAQQIQTLLEQASGKDGRIIQVVAVMGLARIVGKIFSSFIHDFLAQFATDENPKLKALTNNMAYKMIAWSLDYTLSIKLPTNK
jgi:hypothetical protein